MARFSRAASGGRRPIDSRKTSARRGFHDGLRGTMMGLGGQDTNSHISLPKRFGPRFRPGIAPAPRRRSLPSWRRLRSRRPRRKCFACRALALRRYVVARPLLAENGRSRSAAGGLPRGRFAGNLVRAEIGGADSGESRMIANDRPFVIAKGREEPRHGAIRRPVADDGGWPEADAGDEAVVRQSEQPAGLSLSSPPSRRGRNRRLDFCCPGRARIYFGKDYQEFVRHGGGRLHVRSAVSASPRSQHERDGRTLVAGLPDAGEHRGELGRYRGLHACGLSPRLNGGRSRPRARQRRRRLPLPAGSCGINSRMMIISRRYTRGVVRTRTAARPGEGIAEKSRKHEGQSVRSVERRAGKRPRQDDRRLRSAVRFQHRRMGLGAGRLP